MRKSVTSVVLPLLLTVSLVGCAGGSGSQSQGGEQEHSSISSSQTFEGVLYSNLTDQASRDEVSAILQGYGIAQKQIATLFEWVDGFDQRIKSPELPQGFAEMKGNLVDYSGLVLSYPENEEDSWTNQINCRLSTVLLLQDHIATNGIGDAQDLFLMFDVEGIDTQERFQMSEENRTNFVTLYSSVSMAGASTLEEHIQRLQESWKTRDIQLTCKPGLSLVSVYLHEPMDEVRFVGHTGILAETQDGLLFLEKYGPDGPFQATKFHDRTELKTYLLARPDLYGDGTELEPVIFENENVME